jgi:hypothetical protein
MSDWKQRLKYDPTIPLSTSSDISIKYSYELDILGGTDIKASEVWQLKPAQSILKQQNKDGPWEHKSKRSKTWSRVDYDQYETTKQLSELVEKYRFDKNHNAINKIADYFFEHQTDEGDIRGIYGSQYTPNYTALVLELLIKAGYKNDRRIIKSLNWLLGSNQNDGGWALAFRTQGFNLSVFDEDRIVQSDFTKPSSYMVTGVVLRAMAAHPKYRNRPEVHKAACLLADNLLEKDKYPDRKSADYWTHFAFPFQYTDIISALDSLSMIGISPNHPKIQKSLRLLESHQSKNGLFDLHAVRGNSQTQQYWMNLAICRIYKRFFE